MYHSFLRILSRISYYFRGRISVCQAEHQLYILCYAPTYITVLGCLFCSRYTALHMQHAMTEANQQRIFQYVLSSEIFSDTLILRRCSETIHCWRRCSHGVHAAYRTVISRTLCSLKAHDADTKIEKEIYYSLPRPCFFLAIICFTFSKHAHIMPPAFCHATTASSFASVQIPQLIIQEAHIYQIPPRKTMKVRSF